MSWIKLSVRIIVLGIDSIKKNINADRTTNPVNQVNPKNPDLL